MAPLLFERTRMTFPIDAVRGEFPALREGPIFFDNPGGTQVPQRVIDAVSAAMLNASSNLGGSFPSSKNSLDINIQAHEAMKDLLGARSSEEIIIGPSMTTLTLHLSRSIGRLLRPGDEIIVSRMDHEGDVSPWLLLAEDLDLEVKWLAFNRDTWRIEAEDLSALLSDRTRLLALNYASNLTGSINDVRELTQIAKQTKAMVYVDAVQFAPHGFVDVQNLGCDFLACSSYKFFGPHLGVVWGRRELLEMMQAYKCRCASDELPGRYETGTPQTELLAGLVESVEYLAWLGEQVGASGERRGLIKAAFDACTEHERELARIVIEGIEACPDTKIHGVTNPNRMAERVPTVAFTHARLDPGVIAQALGDAGVCLWSGHNYAYEVVRHLGIPEESGVVRVGPAHYNSLQEAERMNELLHGILRDA